MMKKKSIETINFYNNSIQLDNEEDPELRIGYEIFHRRERKRESGLNSGRSPSIYLYYIEERNGIMRVTRFSFPAGTSFDLSRQQRSEKREGKKKRPKRNI